MTTWLIRRLIPALFVVLAMSVIVFIGVHVIGNPVDILISPEADQAERVRIIAGSEETRHHLLIFGTQDRTGCVDQSTAPCQQGPQRVQHLRLYGDQVGDVGRATVQADVRLPTQDAACRARRVE